MLVFTLGANGALMGGRSGCLWAALSPLRLFWGVLGGALPELCLFPQTGNVSATADVQSGRMVGSLAVGR